MGAVTTTAPCKICQKVEVDVKEGVEFGDLCLDCKYRVVLFLGELYKETYGGYKQIKVKDKTFEFTKHGKELAVELDKMKDDLT